MGRSQGALIDAAASKQATCDCDSGYLMARAVSSIARTVTDAGLQGEAGTLSATVTLAPNV
jgi:hypothetical protein